MLTTSSISMAADASVEKLAYGTTADGQGVDEYKLTNAHGVEVKIITCVSTITSIRVPDNDHLSIHHCLS